MEFFVYVVIQEGKMTAIEKIKFYGTVKRI